MTRQMSDAEFEMMLKRREAAMSDQTKNTKPDTPEVPYNPFSKQVGGNHYKQYAIQPYEFFYKNNIPHHKAAIIRRILRFDHPTGKGMIDLDKIIHEVELIKKLWSEETANVTSPDPS